MLLLLASLRLAQGYPPAPHHTIYGLVRDQMGNPLAATNAQVILETMAGVQIKKEVIPNLAAGVNYRLFVPMDTGLTDDEYQPTALRPTVPFRMKVVIGGVTHLPIEMKAKYANLSLPSQSTRIDLTLGEDLDEDGLPDAWERTLLGAGMTLHDIRPLDDLDGDRISNLSEYLAGTYASDPEDGLKLEITQSEGRSIVEFLAITGRSYTLHASSDLQTWKPVSFRVISEGDDAPVRTAYRAMDVRPVRLEVVADEAQLSAFLFLRAQIQ